MEYIDAVEGRPIPGLSVDQQRQLRARLLVLRRELRPRLPILQEGELGPYISNLVGTIRLSASLTVKVAPKTLPQQDLDWPAAVLDLMTSDRFVGAGTRAATSGPPRGDLAAALAYVFADRLELALRSEGPLLNLTERRETGQRLAGRLLTSQWVRHSILRPHVFPVVRNDLSADNVYTTAMSAVAEMLAVASRDTRVSDLLRRLAVAVRPGAAPTSFLDKSVAMRPLPAQWRAYEPAWALVQSIASRTALFRPQGSSSGFEVVLEAWPLLETLLERSLQAAATSGRGQGRQLQLASKVATNLLQAVKPSSGPLTRVHGDPGVIPDGLLLENGVPVASFEAKYSYPTSPEHLRSHIFQALTTAAALQTQVAVLIYPEAAPAVRWLVQGFAGAPTTVAAIGLDLYGYRRGPGDQQRGKLLLDLVP